MAVLMRHKSNIYGLQADLNKIGDLTLLSTTQKNDLVVEYIRDRVEADDIVFLTGVGKIWPIIRSHTILNVLHSVIDSVPLIMFYPGTYSGQNIRLCNEIDDQNYYRAFKLVER